MSPMIEIRNLVKNYDVKKQTRNAVNEVSLSIAEGEMVTLLGPSGCGKTTTLRMIAGLEKPTGGEIVLDGEVVYSGAKKILIPVNKRAIGMVFQSYAIWPHMSVFNNVAFPLKMMKHLKLTKAQIKEKTEQALATVGLSDFTHRQGTDLSGGQQQRVALARALVKEPKILLLDEPLSNLDAKMRERMREEIRELQERLKITSVYVTHDQSEALAISDRIIVMNEGEIVEIGEPQRIYKKPQHPFTANFIGISNTLEGSVANVMAGGAVEVSTEAGSLRCRTDEPFHIGEKAMLFIRPESLQLRADPNPATAWKGRIVSATYQGECWDYVIEVNGTKLRLKEFENKDSLHRGDEVYVEPVFAEVVIRKIADSEGAGLRHAESDAKKIV